LVYAGPSLALLVVVGSKTNIREGHCCCKISLAARECVRLKCSG
jgi:hypothetical protein